MPITRTEIKAAIKARIAAWQREGDTDAYAVLLRDAFEHLSWARGIYGDRGAINRMLGA